MEFKAEKLHAKRRHQGRDWRLTQPEIMLTLDIFHLIIPAEISLPRLVAGLVPSWPQPHRAVW
jgi:hypothetical protein